jgi:hypothetical protein
MAAGFLLLVTGPSGAGKGTLVEQLLHHRPDCVFSVSATTRPKRNTEVEGREYMFLAPTEFLTREAQGWFLETAEVHGHLYGTPVAWVDAQVRDGKVVVLDVDVQGGASVRRVRYRLAGRDRGAARQCAGRDGADVELQVRDHERRPAARGRLAARDPRRRARAPATIEVTNHPRAAQRVRRAGPLETRCSQECSA